MSVAILIVLILVLVVLLHADWLLADICNAIRMLKNKP